MIDKVGQDPPPTVSEAFTKLAEIGRALASANWLVTGTSPNAIAVVFEKATGAKLSVANGAVPAGKVAGASDPTTKPKVPGVAGLVF